MGKRGLRAYQSFDPLEASIIVAEKHLVQSRLPSTLQCLLREHLKLHCKHTQRYGARAKFHCERVPSVFAGELAPKSKYAQLKLRSRSVKMVHFGEYRYACMVPDVYNAWVAQYVLRTRCRTIGLYDNASAGYGVWCANLTTPSLRCAEHSGAQRL